MPYPWRARSCHLLPRIRWHFWMCCGRCRVLLYPSLQDRSGGTKAMWNIHSHRFLASIYKGSSARGPNPHHPSLAILPSVSGNGWASDFCRLAWHTHSVTAQLSGPPPSGANCSATRSCGLRTAGRRRCREMNSSALQKCGKFSESCSHATAYQGRNSGMLLKNHPSSQTFFLP